MDVLLLAKALLLGIVEGLTEFFPISSTGHLIVVGDLIGFNSDSGKVFEVVIQLGAILAVLWEYRARFLSAAAGIGRDPQANRFVFNLFVAFLPAALCGFLFIKAIKAHLFNAPSVAMALIVGGVILLMVERKTWVARVHSVDDMTWKDALKVGIAQIAALVPGTSRSGATIIGGMLSGLDRRTAAEFSFFLAVPMMFAATVYDVYKNWALFSSADLPVFAVGFAAAFVSAFFAVRGLIRYVSQHTFEAFGWYRIVFGVLILLTGHFGWVTWQS
ncbi:MULTISPECIES: undecaprenyl-diphosphate phosphatase [Gulbenkiania]|uniref:Undecaprenyl-diphosphatase n=2 Tax=Gulbenkiania TaxID=397456 RepID=A0A0K6GSK4_9NEIS|nr:MULTISPECIES: undecaprenyl-diphosphate phosphatase [Gulbenkiania]TCW32434.1 undecaprenyl-diphosphatase [Gulbenkiania mobilis]CUA81695.1 undecaprenyl-diphosphatase UppP [Gulbenkiania indica]